MCPRPTPSEEVTRVGSGVSKVTTPLVWANGTTMVAMFVGSCVGGRRYFPYYSYHRNPAGREFFVPAGTFIAVTVKVEIST